LKLSKVCDHNTPTLQTDGETTCDGNTALCTIVHRAAKIKAKSKEQDEVLGNGQRLHCRQQCKHVHVRSAKIPCYGSDQSLDRKEPCKRV